MNDNRTQIDRAEYDHIMLKISEPVREYLMAKYAVNKSPDPISNFTVLNAIGNIVGWIIGSAPTDEARRDIADWFAGILNNSIQDTVENDGQNKLLN